MSDINSVISGYGITPPASFTFQVPSSPVDVTADVNAPATGSLASVGKGITDFFGGLASLFDNGVNIYKSVAGQYQAAQQINKEISGTPAATVATPGASNINMSAIIKIGVIVGIAGLVIFLVRKK